MFFGKDITRVHYNSKNQKNLIIYSEIFKRTRENKLIKYGKVSQMKKYVLIGTGGRGYLMYAKAIVERYSDVAQLVGVFDVNAKRCEYVRDQLSASIPMFTDYDEMMKQTNPDIAIVTTVDRFHKDYILKTLEYGCGVICEKPMTISAEMCNEIMAAEKKYGRNIVVTFNCRFMPYFVKVKELLNQGAVGKILNVDFEWMLDTSHGADYFRRWHRRLENSGGLLVHKSTHHFDIVNWLIEQDPKEIYANGTLKFYGHTREQRGERCCTCEYRSSCEFAYKDAEIPWIKEMYFNAESEDGYFRDRCVFADEINIYDSMSLTVKYAEDTLMTYSLIAHSPYEGWRMTISGTEGRLEAGEYYSGVQAEDPIHHITVYNRKGDAVKYDSKKAGGSHGGGDEKLLRMLFRGDVPDTLHQFAGSRDGAMSAIIGIAANQSIQEKKVILVDDLLNI